MSINGVAKVKNKKTAFKLILNLIFSETQTEYKKKKLCFVIKKSVSLNCCIFLCLK